MIQGRFTTPHEHPLQKTHLVFSDGIPFLVGIPPNLLKQRRRGLSEAQLTEKGLSDWVGYQMGKSEVRILQGIRTH